MSAAHMGNGSGINDPKGSTLFEEIEQEVVEEKGRQEVDGKGGLGAIDGKLPLLHIDASVVVHDMDAIISLLYFRVKLSNLAHGG
jgi:hypothetical protein